MKKRTPNRRLTELLEAIYADPLDDQLRAVYADALQEVGDPRGELIALQLAPTAANDRRARALLAKHRRAWLGAIDPIVEPKDLMFRRGFAARVREVRFVNPARLARDRNRAKLRAAPEWRTVEELEVGSHDFGAAEFLAIPKPALRSVGNVTLWQIGWLAARDVVVPWTALGLEGLLMKDFSPTWQADVAALDRVVPALRVLDAALVHPNDRLLDVLAGSRLAKRLDRLRLRWDGRTVPEQLVEKARAGGFRELELVRVKTEAEASSKRFTTGGTRVVTLATT